MPRERKTVHSGAAQARLAPAGTNAFAGRSTDSITASADGFASLTTIETGRYHDLASQGQGITQPTDKVVYASVPPGNSYNEEHYGTEEGAVPEARSNSTSELLAAYIELEGTMRDAPECDFEWTRPDGITAWRGSTSYDPPQDGYYYEDVGFYTWIGRGFGQGPGVTEIPEPGEYTVEFDTNYGTYSTSVELIGPVVSECSVPGNVPLGSTVEATVTCVKSDPNPYSFDIRLAQRMDRFDTNREALVIAEKAVGMAPTRFQKEFTVPFEVVEGLDYALIKSYATDAY
jgi:hypothetical protein